jgi:predicted dehydrogenase
MKYLTEHGAASATYFETVGPLGVLDEGGVFPVFHVFADVGAFAGGEVYPSRSNYPRVVESLVVTKSGRVRVLLANHTAEPVAVEVAGLEGSFSCRTLDEANVGGATRHPKRSGRRGDAPRAARPRLLPPHGYARLDMDEPALRGALIGCGFFAQHHALGRGSSWQGVELVAVCDRDRARATAFAQTFGIACAYDAAETMLARETLDFVDIVTQASTHAELVGLAARRGLNVICQKPLAPTLEEARASSKAPGSVTLMVHENSVGSGPCSSLNAQRRTSAHSFTGV